MKKQEQIFPIMNQGEGLVEIKESEFAAYWDAHILEGGKLFLIKDGQSFDFTKHQEKVMHLLDPKKAKSQER